MSFTTVCKQGYCVDTTTTTEVLHGPTHVFKQADAAGALTEPPAPSFLWLPHTSVLPPSLWWPLEVKVSHEPHANTYTTGSSLNNNNLFFFFFKHWTNHCCGFVSIPCDRGVVGEEKRRREEEPTDEGPLHGRIWSDPTPSFCFPLIHINSSCVTAFLSGTVLHLVPRLVTKWWWSHKCSVHWHRPSGLGFRQKERTD